MMEKNEGISNGVRNGVCRCEKKNKKKKHSEGRLNLR